MPASLLAAGLNAMRLSAHTLAHARLPYALPLGLHGNFAAV
jgi:hypothetical protein